MNQRRLGKTGLLIPKLVLGGGYTGGVLILADEAERETALQRAVDAGVDWFDTAPLYGNGESELTIGRHLKSLPRRPRISTKVGLDAEDLTDIEGAIRRSLEQSFTRLGIDQVELLQLHNPLGSGGPQFPVPLSAVLGKGGIAEVLQAMKAEGLIAASGYTALGDPEACLRVASSGMFDTAQVYYNMLNPSAAWARVPTKWRSQDFSGLLAACRAQGMGVLGIRVFAGGALASMQRHGREFVLDLGSTQEQEEARASALFDVLGLAEDDMAETALRFVLSRPEVSCAVIGVADVAQLEAALRAQEKGALGADAQKKVHDFHCAEEVV